MIINGKVASVPAEWEEASLLEYLRDYLGLTGSKYSCGRGICGACTVHVNGSAVRSCVVPVTALTEEDGVTTIEGLGTEEALHPVQQAWREMAVPQCGFCQPGQIMAAAAFLAENPDPDEAEVTEAMSANLCRCGTYTRIRSGVLHAARLARELT